jgi:hypothetical protein
VSENLEALREWYGANKTSPEFLLAQKHRHAMGPGVAEALKANAPGDSDEEKELSLMFSMTQIAEKLDMHAVLLAGITADMIPTKHVDVTPLERPSTKPSKP